MPSAAIGMSIRKTEPHQKWSSSRPPTSGPSGMPPEAAEIMPTALPRSSGLNRAGSTAGDSGMIGAAADVHDRAGGDHRVHVPGQGAEHRAGQEDAEPGGQRPAPPEPVAEQARRQHQRGGDDDVKRPRLG